MATETKEKRSARQYKAASRRDVSSLARGYCRSGNNISYLIAEAAPDSATGMASILVSNWSFDTIEDVGSMPSHALSKVPFPHFPVQRRAAGTRLRLPHSSPVMRLHIFRFTNSRKSFSSSSLRERSATSP
ncbi:hypothetical protein [Nitratireductor aquibiodomus]|uniref:hypothetical protein n=1 Tax=Nitratireductor aquibiodomus TaxID=204799 RepID=UPI001FCC8089|nr:hypothetical protein [Nitratireductor aquibiodomus]